MTTYVFPLTVALGQTFAAQATALTADFYDTANVHRLGPIAFSEIGGSTGAYEANPTLDSAWGPGRMRYTWTGTPTIPLIPSDPVAISPMLLDLTQRYDQAVYVKGSIGHMFRRWRAKFFSKSTADPVANTITYLGTDDATIEYVDTFDNLVAPTQRNQAGST